MATTCMFNILSQECTFGTRCGIDLGNQMYVTPYIFSQRKITTINSLIGFSKFYQCKAMTMLSYLTNL